MSNVEKMKKKKLLFDWFYDLIQGNKDKKCKFSYEVFTEAGDEAVNML